MPPTTAAMELKVLISVLQSGTALQNLLNQTKQLTTALTQLQQQAGKVPQNLPAPPIPPKEKIDDATKALMRLDGALNSVVRGLKFLAGGFLALEGVRFLKDLADTAARAEVLSTVLHVVGNNAGYTTAALDKADRQIQSLGITASAARQSLTQFIQAELELSKAPELARAAQDAAVILGTNSSDAFERLVTAVQTSNTLMLRHMGIIVSADAAYQKYAQSIGKSVSQLTSAQRAQAFLNATIEQTKRIQGSYTAAMGDVGKQLTSLDRLTTDLKTSLGNNLLPAYLAVVEELTLFLQHMGLAADEMYGQGQGAKKLGEEVKSLVSNLRILLEFFVEYRKELLYVLLLWAGVGKVLVPVIGWIFKLKDAFSGAAGAGVLGRLITGVGLLGSAMILLGAALIGAMFVFDRFNAAVGTVVGAIWTLLEVVDLVMGAFSTGVLAAFKTVLAIMSNPFSPSTWLKPWKEWAQGVVDQINYIKQVWDNTKARFGQAFGKDAGKPTPEQDAQTARAKRFAEEANLLTDIMLKTREFNELKKGASAEATKQAEKELKLMKDKAAAMAEARKAEQTALGFSQSAKDLEEERLRIAVDANAERRLTQKLEDARKDAKFRYPEGGGEVGVAFQTQLGQFNDMLDIYNTSSNKAKINTMELFRNLKESAGLAKTSGDFQALGKAVTDFAQTPGIPRALIQRARGLLATAGLQVRDETLAETSRLEKDRETHFREMEKRQSDHLEHELNMLQSAFDIRQAMDEQAYTRQGMDLDKYFDRRLARLEEETAQELLIAKNNLASLEEERQKKIPRTPQEVEALDTRIQKATDALAELQGDTGTIQARILKLGIEREDARADKLLKSKQTLLDIAAIYGGEEAALAAVNNKFDEQYNKANTAEERAAIQAERRKEVFETELKYREQLLQLDLQRIHRGQDALELEQARIDATRSHIATAEKRGDITGFEAQTQRNALLRQQVAHDEQLVISKTVEMRRLLLELAKEEQRIREDMAGKSEELIQARLATDLEARRQQVQGLAKDIYKLNEGIADTAAQAESYSKTLQEHFIDGFADALTTAITDYKNAGEAFVSLSKSITNEIVGIFTKAFTQNLFKKLNLFGFADQLMAGIFGNRGGSSMNTPLPGAMSLSSLGLGKAEGGPVHGPGTGTSDSIPAFLSAGEHVMPANKAQRYMPLLEGIRTGRIVPYSTGGPVQSIALGSVIPRYYATGGVVVADGGASSVQTGGGMGNMMVTMHPDTLNMTMREWLEHEVVRQQGRR
jgi:hypothetical protein